MYDIDDGETGLRLIYGHNISYNSLHIISFNHHHSCGLVPHCFPYGIPSQEQYKSVSGILLK